MIFPFVPKPDVIAAHFIGVLQRSRRLETPYRRWALTDVFPEALCTAILVLPIAPPMLGATDGTRNTYNARRTFFTPELRAQFPGVRKALSERCSGPTSRASSARRWSSTPTEPSAHRIHPGHRRRLARAASRRPREDLLDGRLSLHRPARQGLGHRHLRRRQEVGRPLVAPSSTPPRSSRPGTNTWHGFDKRPIIGVRRLMEINYVRDWRDREQLAFPDTPVSTI